MAERLTRREQEVAALVATGRTNGQIAAALGVSPTTAKWYISEILRKLGFTSRVQVGIYARDHHLTADIRPSSD